MSNAIPAPEQSGAPASPHSPWSAQLRHLLNRPVVAHEDQISGRTSETPNVSRTQLPGRYERARRLRSPEMTQLIQAMQQGHSWAADPEAHEYVPVPTADVSAEAKEKAYGRAFQGYLCQVLDTDSNRLYQLLYMHREMLPTLAAQDAERASRLSFLKLQAALPVWRALTDGLPRTGRRARHGEAAAAILVEVKHALVQSPDQLMRDGRAMLAGMLFAAPSAAQLRAELYGLDN